MVSLLTSGQKLGPYELVADVLAGRRKAENARQLNADVKNASSSSFSGPPSLVRVPAVLRSLTFSLPIAFSEPPQCSLFRRRLASASVSLPRWVRPQHSPGPTGAAGLLSSGAKYRR